ncbi:hypothetical protein predicted by Glimmer/Critica [Acetobacter ghanensis]|uniref:Uncharacterized protein n=1 Tax=Acetobacter ghanensis TaxID=431306 RepID=A0A0U5BIG9_9PROT|nr:hypothetical protein predicted by Glimmer/Critica [Acetobacter ghanensis]
MVVGHSVPCPLKHILRSVFFRPAPLTDQFGQYVARSYLRIKRHCAPDADKFFL